jgi:ribosomal protein S18 acetylase RimI-like enzyme
MGAEESSGRSTASPVAYPMVARDGPAMSSEHIRPVDIVRDMSAIVRLDVSFTTQHMFALEATDTGICLKSVPLGKPIEKRFPVAFEEGHTGWVVTGNASVLGFIATAIEPWNKRLVVWHFYVDRQHRKRGLGRLLIEHAIDCGRHAGATNVWVETSNLNYPGVLAYRRLGFEVCGFDSTLYENTPSEGEFAVFLGRSVTIPHAEKL